MRSSAVSISEVAAGAFGARRIGDSFRHRGLGSARSPAPRRRRHRVRTSPRCGVTTEALLLLGAGQSVVPVSRIGIKIGRDGEVLSGVKSDAGDAAVIASGAGGRTAPYDNKTVRTSRITT